MKIKRILFPTDFSIENEAALKLASILAAESHAQLYIVHVHEIRNISAEMCQGGFMKAATLHEERRKAWERLTTIVPLVRGVRYEYELLTGAPVVELLQFALGMQVDLIVMSSHGRSGMRGLANGQHRRRHYAMRKMPCSGR
jgi:nucleotide-binding universal stress UspA family protein